MSIFRPEELRYAKLDSVKEERSYLNTVYQELIRFYGYDTTYYRRDTDYTSEDESEMMIYGYKSDPRYSKHTNIRTLVKFNDYTFILNGEGFVPSDKLQMYFGINEFATSFIDDIGAFNNFKVQETTGYAIERRGTITVPFSSEVYSGELLVYVKPNQIVKQTEDFEIKNSSIPCYSVAYNPYLYKSLSTDYRNGYFASNINVDYDSTHGRKIWYKVYGDVLYSNFFQNEKVLNEIHPNPGDIVEIDFHTQDGVKEQYEITEVVSRKPLDADGISPLVGKYVYLCNAVRRIAQHEEVAPEEKSIDARNNMMDYSQKRSEAIDNTFDHSSPSATVESNVYGGYAKANVFHADSSLFEKLHGKIEDIFDYGQYREDWNTKTVTDEYDICTFTDGTKLITDGINLFWGETLAAATQLTNIPLSSTSLSSTGVTAIPEIMYLRVMNGQLYFTTCDTYEKRKLTHFEKPLIDSSPTFEYLDGFGFKDIGYRNNNGYYIFKNSRMALNSFSKKYLMALADNGEDPEILCQKD
jgi:hypothetical protein